MKALRCLVFLVSMLGWCAAGLAQSDLIEGEKLYIAHCRMCHGFNEPAQARWAPDRPAAVLVAHAPTAATTARDLGGQLAFAPPFGPNLRGIIGREAGTAPDFEYSRAFLDALKGMVWTEGTLDWWIRDTQAWVPGVVMYYRQPDPEVRRKIIAFLKANP